MKTVFSLLLVIALLFSLSAAAFSDCLDNGPLGLTVIESKIITEEEVAVAVDREILIDVTSVESIQCESILLSNNTIGYGSQNREYNITRETGLDTTIKIRLPPTELTA